MVHRTLSIDRYTNDVRGLLEREGFDVRQHGSAFFPALHLQHRQINQRLYAEIESFAPEFVHTTGTWLAYQHRRISAPARLATCHDLYQVTIPNFFQPSLRSKADVFLLKSARKGFQAADQIICISSWTASKLVDWAQVDPTRISVVHNTIVESFQPVPDARARLAEAGITLPHGPTMLTVGTPGWTKNLAVIVRAMCAPGMRGVRYVRVGPPLPPDLAAHARNLGVEDRIHEIGLVDEAILPAIYSACDVLVQPSRVEGFGYPVAEAMACGTAVVCSDGGSLPQVAADAALIVPLYEPAHLADEGRDFAAAIELVVSDQALRAELEAKGLERVKAFRPDAIAPQMKAAYEKARENRAKR